MDNRKLVYLSASDLMVSRLWLSSNAKDRKFKNLMSEAGNFISTKKNN
jgi:hypothetical protein